MPVSIKKLPGKSRYRVSTPGGTKAKATTLKKAKAQERLLHAVDKGWKPIGKKRSESIQNLPEISPSVQALLG